MKVCLALIFSILGWLCMAAETPVEYFTVGDPIKYCGTDYSLVWSSHPREDYYLQEYLPAGESLDHFNNMFSINILFGDITPEEAKKVKILELEKRKKVDPVTNYKTMTKDGKHILEFLVAQSHDDKLEIAEVNVYYYRQMTLDGKKACVLYFYSSRAYGDDILPFIKAIPDHRVDWYEGMIALKGQPKILK